MSRNKLSESEFRQVSSSLDKQVENLNSIMQQVNGAVTGADWKAAAAANFSARWTDDRTMLTHLREALVEWSKDLRNKHAPAAHEINLPTFKR